MSDSSTGSDPKVGLKVGLKGKNTILLPKADVLFTDGLSKARQESWSKRHADVFNFVDRLSKARQKLPVNSQAEVFNMETGIIGKGREWIVKRKSMPNTRITMEIKESNAGKQNMTIWQRTWAGLFTHEEVKTVGCSCGVFGMIR